MNWSLFTSMFFQRVSQTFKILSSRASWRGTARFGSGLLPHLQNGVKTTSSQINPFSGCNSKMVEHSITFEIPREGFFDIIQDLVYSCALKRNYKDLLRSQVGDCVRFRILPHNFRGHSQLVFAVLYRAQTEHAPFYYADFGLDLPPLIEDHVQNAWLLGMTESQRMTFILSMEHALDQPLLTGWKSP